MRTAILTLAAAVTLAAANPSTDAKTGPVIPRKAPELVIQMVGGQTIGGRQALLSQFRGHAVALAFMITTCSHCQHLASVLGPIQQEYASKGVQVLGVLFNPEANMEGANFAKVWARNLFPIGMSTDQTVADFVQHPPGMHYVPMMVFIDKTGIIRGQHLGINDSAFFTESVEIANIKKEIDNLLTPASAAKKK
jgi:hypothetical protein